MANMFEGGSTTDSPVAEPIRSPSMGDRVKQLKCFWDERSARTRFWVKMALGAGLIYAISQTDRAHQARVDAEDWLVHYNNNEHQTTPAEGATAGLAAHARANVAWQQITDYVRQHPTDSEDVVRTANPVLFRDLETNATQALNSWTIALGKPADQPWATFIESRPEQNNHNGFSAGWGYCIAFDLYRGSGNVAEAANVFHHTMSLPGWASSHQVCTRGADNPGLLNNAHNLGFARFDIASARDGSGYVGVPGAQLNGHPTSAVFTIDQVAAFRAHCPNEGTDVLPDTATFVPVQQ